MVKTPDDISELKLLTTDEIRHIYACHYESSCCKEISRTEFDESAYYDIYNDGYLTTFKPFDIKGSVNNPPFSGEWKKYSPPFFLNNSGELYSLSADVFTTGYEENIIGKISGSWKDVASYNGEVNVAIDSGGLLYMWGPFSSYNAKDQFQNVSDDPKNLYVQRPKYERVEHKVLNAILDCSIKKISDKNRGTKKRTSIRLSQKNFDPDSSVFYRYRCGQEIGSGCLVNPEYRYFLTDAVLGGSPIAGSGNTPLSFQTVKGPSIRTFSEAKYTVNLRYILTGIDIISQGDNYTSLQIIFYSPDQQATLPTAFAQLQNGKLVGVSVSPGSSKYLPSYSLIGDGVGAEISLRWHAYPQNIKISDKGSYGGMEPVRENNTKFLKPWEIKFKDIVDIVYPSGNTTKSLLYENNRNYTGIHATIVDWNIINSGSGYSASFDDKVIYKNNLGEYIADLNPGKVKCLSEGCQCEEYSPRIRNYNNDNLHHSVSVYGQLYGRILDSWSNKPPSNTGLITDGKINTWFIAWGPNLDKPTEPPPWTFSMTVDNATYVNLPISGWSSVDPIAGDARSFSGVCANDYLLAAYVEPTYEEPKLNVLYGSEHYGNRNIYEIKQGVVTRKVDSLNYNFSLNKVYYADPEKLLFEPEPIIKTDKLIVAKRTKTWISCADTTASHTAFCKTIFTGTSGVICFPPPGRELKNSFIIKKPKLNADIYYKLYDNGNFYENPFQITASVGYELDDDNDYKLDNLFEKISYIYFDVNDDSNLFTVEPEIHVYNYPILPLPVGDNNKWDKVEVGMNIYDPNREDYRKEYNWIPVAISNNKKPWVLADYFLTPLINREVYSEHVPYWSGELPYNASAYAFFYTKMHCYRAGDGPITSRVNSAFYGTPLILWGPCDKENHPKYDPFDCLGPNPTNSWFAGYLPLGKTFTCGCYYPKKDQPHAPYDAYWEWFNSMNITQYPTIFISRILHAVGKNGGLGWDKPEYKVVNNTVVTIPDIENMYATNANYAWERYDFTLALENWVPIIFEEEDRDKKHIYHTVPPLNFPKSTPSRPLSLDDHRIRKNLKITKYIPVGTEGETETHYSPAKFSIACQPDFSTNGLDAALDIVNGDAADWPSWNFVTRNASGVCKDYGAFNARWHRGDRGIGPPINQIIKDYNGNNICFGDSYRPWRGWDHEVVPRTFGQLNPDSYSYPEMEDIDFNYVGLEDQSNGFNYYIPSSKFLPLPKISGNSIGAEFSYNELSKIWGEDVSYFTCRDYALDGNIMGGIFPTFAMNRWLKLGLAIIIFKDIQTPPITLAGINGFVSSDGKYGPKQCLPVVVECYTIDNTATPPRFQYSSSVVDPQPDSTPGGRDDFFYAMPVTDYYGYSPRDYAFGKAIGKSMPVYFLNDVPAYGECNPFLDYPPQGTLPPRNSNCQVVYPVNSPMIGNTGPWAGGGDAPLAVLYERQFGNWIRAVQPIRKPFLRHLDRQSRSITFRKNPIIPPVTRNIVCDFVSEWGSFCSFKIPSSQGSKYYDHIDINDFKDTFEPLAIVPFRIKDDDDLLYIKDHGPINFEIWRLTSLVSAEAQDRLINNNNINVDWKYGSIPWISGTTEIEWYEQGGHEGSIHRYNMDFWLEQAGRDIKRSKHNQFNPLLYIDNNNEIRNSLFYWSMPLDRVHVYRAGDSQKHGGKIELSTITMYDSGNHPYFDAHIPLTWSLPNYFVNYRVQPSSLPDNGLTDIHMPGIPVILSSGIPTLLETVDLKFSAGLNQVIIENTGSESFTSPPLVHIDPPSANSGVQARAECEIEGPLKLALINGGGGYNGIPYLEFIGTGIPPVIDELSIISGQITSIKVLMDGIYRRGKPDIILHANNSGQGAQISGIFTGYPVYVNIIDAGKGYEYPPHACIIGSGYSSHSISGYESLPTTTRLQASITGGLNGSGLVPSECVIFNKWNKADPTDQLLSCLYYDPKWGGNILFHDNQTEYSSIVELTGILVMDEWDYGPGRYDYLAREIHDCNEGLRIAGVTTKTMSLEDYEFDDFTPIPGYGSMNNPIKPSITIADGGVLFLPSRLKRLRIVGEVGPNSKLSRTETSCNKTISITELSSKKITILNREYTIGDIKWSTFPDIRIYDICGSGAIISGSLNVLGYINSINFANQGNCLYTEMSVLQFIKGSLLFDRASFTGTLDATTSGVQSISIVNNGYGYYPAPYNNYNTIIDHNTGSGLEISVQTYPGSLPSAISKVSIINHGSGYSKFPKITILNNDQHYPQKIIGAINLSLRTDPANSFKNISDWELDHIPNKYKNKPKYLISETEFDVGKYYYRHNGIADVSVAHSHKGINKFYNTIIGGTGTLPKLNIAYPTGYQSLHVEFISYDVDKSNSGSTFLSSDRFVPEIGYNQFQGQSEFYVYKGQF